MKRIYVFFTLSICFAFPAFPQGTPVFDIERLFQTIFNFSDEMTESIRQTGQIIDQLDKTKRIYDNWKKVADKLSVVSEYVGRVEDVEEMYRMLKRTAELLQQGRDVILDDNYLDVNRKLSYVNTLVADMTGNVDRIQVMISRYSPGSKEGGNMDDGQREDLKGKEMEEAKAVNAAMSLKIEDAKAESAVNRYSEASYYGSMNALGGF